MRIPVGAYENVRHQRGPKEAIDLNNAIARAAARCLAADWTAAVQPSTGIWSIRGDRVPGGVHLVGVCGSGVVIDRGENGPLHGLVLCRHGGRQ